jgi:hypothetical protein
MGNDRRQQLMSLSFAEKLRILDKLRARSLAIAAAGLREPKQEPGKKSLGKIHLERLK